MTPLYYKTYTEIEKQEIIIQDKNKKTMDLTYILGMMNLFQKVELQ